MATDCTRLEAGIVNAREEADALGHELGDFGPHHGYAPKVEAKEATCKLCKATRIVLVRPGARYAEYDGDQELVEMCPREEGHSVGDYDEKDGCYQCIVCEAALTKPGGYADTGMCGPCCTGEAATLDEFGDTW